MLGDDRPLDEADCGLATGPVPVDGIRLGSTSVLLGALGELGEFDGVLVLVFQFPLQAMNRT